jgi:hypothetical protein
MKLHRSFYSIFFVGFIFATTVESVARGEKKDNSKVCRLLFWDLSA